MADEILDQQLEVPEVAPVPEAAGESAPESNDTLWEDLALDTEDADPFPAPQDQATPATPPAPEEKPAVPGSVATPQVPAAPVTAPVPPVAQPPASTAPLPQAAAQPSTGEAPVIPTTEQLMTQRNQLIDQIASRYSFTPEQEAQLQTEPEKVLPVIAARLQVETFEAVLQTVMAQIPTVLATHRQQEDRATQYNNAFYGRWPALRDAKYNPRLTEVAQAYRQANPRATPEQAIESIGAMVHVMEGIPVPTPASASAPAAVAPQMVPASSMRPPTPAGVGASTRPAAVPSTPNIFEELALFEG